MTATAGPTVAPGATIFQANGVLSSIYIVYLKGIGLTGTSIGTLFALDRRKPPRSFDRGKPWAI